jgi:hypothetical protein
MSSENKVEETPAQLIDPPPAVVKLDEIALEDKEKPALEDKKDTALIEKPKSEMNLLEIVLEYTKLEKQSILLTPKVKSLLQKLPTVDKKHLENVEGFFDDIMKDKKINMKDLPALIGLVQELFIMYESMKLKVNSFDVGAVLRVLIQLLLQYKLEKDESTTPEQKNAILESLDMVLQLSTQMIELKDTQKKLKGWCSSFGCM